MTAREALGRYYAGGGLEGDGGASAPRWKPLRRLGLSLPNFGWRRRALQRHDLHHLLTGYPCTACGEFEAAAWEFAAGCCPETAAVLFCLPLVGLGAVAAPRRVFHAYLLGRRSHSLHREPSLTPLLDLPIVELRALCLPRSRPRARFAYSAGYGVLVALSLAWMALPLLLLAAGLRLARG